jgi:hypothetical protein
LKSILGIVGSCRPAVARLTLNLVRRHNRIESIVCGVCASQFSEPFMYRGPGHRSDESRRTFIVLAVAIVGAPVARYAQSQDASAALVQAVHERPSGRDMTSVGRMELIESGRSPRVRDIVTYRLSHGGGSTSVLVRFVSPTDIAGTGLLSVEKADGGNDQWIYLPALDRVRRVAGDRKGGRFVGSDLYFEDLRERKPERDRHRLIGREIIAGVSCEIVESRPLDAGDSVYRKRINWIDPLTALVHRVDYYEKDEQSVSKQWILLSTKKVQGYWVVTDSRMTDLGTGHQTRMTVDVVRFDRRLPAKLFSTQALADPGLEEEFRP